MKSVRRKLVELLLDYSRYHVNKSVLKRNRRMSWCVLIVKSNLFFLFGWQGNMISLHYTLFSFSLSINALFKQQLATFIRMIYLVSIMTFLWEHPVEQTLEHVCGHKPGSKPKKLKGTSNNCLNNNLQRSLDWYIWYQLWRFYGNTL